MTKTVEFASDIAATRIRDHGNEPLSRFAGSAPSPVLVPIPDLNSPILRQRHARRKPKFTRTETARRPRLAPGCGILVRDKPKFTGTGIASGALLAQSQEFACGVMACWGPVGRVRANCRRPHDESY